MIEGTVNRLDQFVERFAMHGQGFEMVVDGKAAAQFLPCVATVADEHVEVRRADFDEARVVVFDERGVNITRLVSERALLPELAMKAERAAGRPAVARITHLRLA